MNIFEKLLSAIKGEEIVYYRASEEATGSEGRYKFAVRYVAGGWRAYVLECPVCSARKTSGDVIHLYGDSKGGVYVCVTEKVKSKSRMIAIAKLWARRYQRYVATGKDFNE